MEAKADVKVSAFEAAVKNAKPYLDKIDTKYAANYLVAAATAHELTSAYRLVGVLTTLDDLSLDGRATLLTRNHEQNTLGPAPMRGSIFF